MNNQDAAMRAIDEELAGSPEGAGSKQHMDAMKNQIDTLQAENKKQEGIIQNQAVMINKFGNETGELRRANNDLSSRLDDIEGRRQEAADDDEEVDYTSKKVLKNISKNAVAPELTALEQRLEKKQNETINGFISRLSAVENIKNRGFTEKEAANIVMDADKLGQDPLVFADTVGKYKPQTNHNDFSDPPENNGRLGAPSAPGNNQGNIGTAVESDARWLKQKTDSGDENDVQMFRKKYPERYQAALNSPVGWD